MQRGEKKLRSSSRRGFWNQSAAGHEWKESLHEKHEIKQLQTPPNRETVTDVSGENRVDSRRELKVLRRRDEDFDEPGRVPIFDKTQIEIHHAIEFFRVSAEQLRAPGDIIEHRVERVGGLFAGKHREENARAENRIDETRRIACEH